MDASESARGPYEVRIVEDRWTTFRHIVEGVAILCAGLWAFYTFVYQEQIKPSNEPAALSLGISIESLGHDSIRDDLSVTMVFQNTGKTEIDVAADAYNVWGQRYGRRQILRKAVTPTERRYEADLPVVSSRLIAAFAELRDAAVGGRRGNHIIIEPGASDTITHVFAVPRGVYDLVRGQVIAVPVKTTMAAKVPVTVVELPSAGYGFETNSPTFEDDSSAEFVLPR